MGKCKKILITMFLFLMMLGTVSTVSYASPRFNKTSVTLKKKKSKSLKLKSISGKQKKKQWKFSSSDKSIVTVKKTSKTSCRIKAKKKDGYAVVKASQGGVVVYALVRVGTGGAPTYNVTTSTWALAGALPLPGLVASTTAAPTPAPTPTPTPAPTPTPTPTPTPAEQPEFSVDSTTVNIDSSGQGLSSVTFAGNGDLFYEDFDEMEQNIDCFWDDVQSGNVFPLYIEVYREGTFPVKITNSEDSREINLTVIAEDVPDFYVSSMNVEVKGSTTIFVTFESQDENDEIIFDVDDPTIVSCEWGEFDGNVCPLYIYGDSIGETQIGISNTHDDRSHWIDVNVTETYE